MGKLLLIARANVRKAKGQTVAIIVLILLAALMLDLWLMLGQFVFTEKTEALERSIGRAEIIGDGGGESGVYLPMLYESDDIAVGKHVEITVGSYTAKYTVIGFFNSIMMGSHNCSLTQILITKDKYDELAESGAAMASTLCSVRTKDRATSSSRRN